ncbi:MAG TPA: MBL fold metallo-hydrolase [Candidatus Limnocylindrales bacterium]|nr:MBL fold metallo-hydrolase [Candidatus Limnocylindrales bacterium]
MSKKRIFLTLLFLISFLLLFIYQDKEINNGKLKVVFCDVGQGDGIYIRTPEGQDIIVDGGPDNSILLCLSENMPFWDREIELMILTHPHADHYTGLISIAKSYKVLSFASSLVRESDSGYKALAGILDNQKIPKRFICQGDKFSLKSGVSFEILWPRSCDLSKTILSTDPNDNSVVGLLSYKDFQLLLTGDAGEGVEDLVDNIVGDIDVLKVPHHGSRTGFDSEFLNVTKPELAVISVGDKNRYKHPAPNILGFLKTGNIKTFRTDKQGSIRISSDGITYSVASSKY